MIRIHLVIVITTTTTTIMNKMMMMMMMMMMIFHEIKLPGRMEFRRRTEWVEVYYQKFTFVFFSSSQTRLPVYYSHTPAGTSVRDMVHFAQVYLVLYTRFDADKLTLTFP